MWDSRAVLLLRFPRQNDSFYKVFCVFGQPHKHCTNVVGKFKGMYLQRTATLPVITLKPYLDLRWFRCFQSRMSLSFQTLSKHYWMKSFLNACGHVCRYVDQKASAAMLASIQSAGVAPEVNLRITQVRKHAKGFHPGFETQDRRHQESKTGVSVVPR